MLKLNHLTGFGSGAGAAAAGADVTSYAFDGTGDYLSIPDHADWDIHTGGDFTIEFFIRLPDPTIEIYPLTQHVATTDEWRVQMSTNGTMRYAVRDSGSTEVSLASTAGLIEANTWHHIAVVRSTNDYYIYIDGVDQTASGSPDSSNGAALAGSVYIGQRGNGSGYITGYMDEIRISNSVRYPSGTTFVPSTTQFTSDANTLLLIHGGEAIASGTTGSGATFVDSGNTGHTVTENGNAQRETEQEFKFTDDGVGYFFDGTGDWLGIPDHTDFVWTSDFTIEAWIRVPTTSPGNTVLFSHYVDNNNQIIFGVYSGGELIYTANNSELAVDIASLGTAQGSGYLANKWCHVAVTRESDDYDFWINGVHAGNNTDSDTAPTLAGSIFIGQRGNSANYFNGYIDELRVSDTARYTTGFTPSSTQFTSDANTLLLIHGGETKSGTTGSGATFTDSGNTGHTVTEVGNAIESTGNLYKF